MAGLHDAIPAPPFDLAAAWRHVRAAWAELPPQWRNERALVVAGLVAALALLAAFAQVVQGGVERAAARDAAAYRQLNLAAVCSIERDAAQRALCLLTRPASRGDLRVATAAR